MSDIPTKTTKITHINFSELDQQRIYRFVDLSALKKSIGENNVASLNFNFLSTYRTHEDPSRKDAMEGVTTCNEALISCWTHFYDENQIVKTDIDTDYVIMSTVRKFRELTSDLYQTQNISFGENGLQPLFLNSVCGYVSYHPEIVEKLPGADSETIRSIFIKRNSFRNQKEFRFAIIMNHIGQLNSEETLIYQNVKNNLIYPTRTLPKNKHYIDKVLCFGKKAYENYIDTIQCNIVSEIVDS